MSVWVLVHPFFAVSVVGAGAACWLTSDDEPSAWAEGPALAHAPLDGSHDASPDAAADGVVVPLAPVVAGVPPDVPRATGLPPDAVAAVVGDREPPDVPELDAPDPVVPVPDADDPEPDPRLVTLDTDAAPPVPVVHCVAPCLSHAGGSGAVFASRFVPSLEKVGLLQLVMTMFYTTAPGIFRIWSKLACTRLTGIGE
jgi:hypothetical protein